MFFLPGDARGVPALQFIQKRDNPGTLLITVSEGTEKGIWVMFIQPLRMSVVN